MSGRAVFLDRDGVLNRDLPGSVRSVEELELLDGAPEAVARLTRAGYRVIVVTNQSIIGRGLVAASTVDSIHEELARRVRAAGGTIEGFVVCPHAPADGCDCRKPRPGLLLAASRRYGVDLGATWFVGDKRSDNEAARAAGCLPALVRSGAALNEPSLRDQELGERIADGAPVFEDLTAFVDALLAALLDASAQTPAAHPPSGAGSGAP